LTGLVDIADLFQGTIFYILVGLATIFTLFGFGVFLKNRAEIKRKSESFSEETLENFVERKKSELETETNEKWDSFFDEVESLRKPRDGKEALKKIRERVEKFSEEFSLLKSRDEIVNKFEARMKQIYSTWKTLFKRTYLLFFSFVIFSGVSVFLMNLPWTSYIGNWAEYLTLLLMIAGLALFLSWAYYFYSSIRYHFYGDVDDFLLGTKIQVEKNLESYFTRYVKRWKRTQELLKSVLPALLEQYPLGYFYKSALVLRRVLRAAKD
jgi:hypothetical protein